MRDGDHSEWILRHWHGRKLYLVDPWLKQNEKVYFDVSNVRTRIISILFNTPSFKSLIQRDQDGQEVLFQFVTKLMEKFPNRYEILRTFSVEASRSILARAQGQPSLDFVYLDARHDYEGIKEDLNAWWPLLKQGGLIAGHDFVEDGVNSAGLFGVQRAVGNTEVR